MALPKMPIRDESRDDENHATSYQASRGGWYKAEDKPVPDEPKG